MAKQALVVPASALGAKSADGAFSVRVLTEGGKVDLRQVRVGLNNQVKAQVLEGLREGERVIVGEASSDGDAAHGAAEG
jgi:macrolide-specific efflux system membrane fusion protein